VASVGILVESSLISYQTPAVLQRSIIYALLSNTQATNVIDAVPLLLGSFTAYRFYYDGKCPFARQRLTSSRGNE
jgi:hypothetical protein